MTWYSFTFLNKMYVSDDGNTSQYKNIAVHKTKLNYFLVQLEIKTSGSSIWNGNKNSLNVNNQHFILTKVLKIIH